MRYVHMYIQKLQIGREGRYQIRSVSISVTLSEQKIRFQCQQ